MPSGRFVVPVTVFVGLGAQRELTSTYELLQFLNEWPQGRRGPIFTTAQRACNAALAGELTNEDARKAFSSFARACGILAPTVEPVAAAHLPKRPGAARF